MKITNVEVSGVASSIVASGYAMRLNIEDCPHEIESLAKVVSEGKEMTDADKKHIARLLKLGSQEAGSGHRSLLKGIIVSADFERTQCIDHQMQRYSFFQYLTGQSTMHRAKEMKLEGMCHERTSKKSIENAQELIDFHNNYDKMVETGSFSQIELDSRRLGIPYPESKKHLFESVCYSLPQGLQLTVRVSTNYECLLNMYFQRRYHKLSEWRVFCGWVYSLPFMSDIIDIIDRKRAEGRWQTDVTFELEPLDGRNFVAELNNGDLILGKISYDCILVGMKQNGVKRWKLI